MSYLPTDGGELLAINTDATRETGKELHDAHMGAAPFPHTVIDDFLPRAVIDYCLTHFPQKLGDGSQTFDRDQERYKASFNPDEMSPGLRQIFYTFNSRPFIKVIENITGIRGLIPDPYFMGAGFHEIGTGGHLSVHVDFNHHKPMDLERRVNLLIYLNDDWEAEHGGQLEFWNEDMTECVQSIVPRANRAALFTLSDKSYHGNPTLVNHPDGRTRKSIALYYYTATWDDQQRPLTTQFKRRQGTEDKVDWDVKTDEFLSEILPPIIARKAVRLKHKLTNHIKPKS